MSWYLVMFTLYMGPIHEDSCKMAAIYLKGEGVQCKQADYLYACAVDGRPGTYTTCPHFNYPQVTIK